MFCEGSSCRTIWRVCSLVCLFALLADGELNVLFFDLVSVCRLLDVLTLAMRPCRIGFEFGLAFGSAGALAVFEI